MSSGLSAGANPMNQPWSVPCGFCAVPVLPATARSAPPARRRGAALHHRDQRVAQPVELRLGESQVDATSSGGGRDDVRVRGRVPSLASPS